MQRPYITLKYAQTLDGRIAAKDGSSRWISSPPSRRFAHKLRNRNDAVLVGINTVLADNPSLTTRLVKGKNPARIVIDPTLRIPLNSKFACGTQKSRTIIITAPCAPKRKIEKLKKRGIEFIILPKTKKGYIDLKRIIGILYKKGIKKLLVEGGGGTITSFLKSRLVDEIITVISPKILGSGVNTIGELGISNIKKALSSRIKKVQKMGNDIILTICP